MSAEPKSLGNGAAAGARVPADGISDERKEWTMTGIVGTAQSFFEACEAGGGWESCQQYCHPGATFAAQAAALEGIDNLQNYTEWMKGLYTPVPDGHAEIRSLAVDDARSKVLVYGIFYGTHTGEGGPVPPTGKSLATDSVYDISFEDGKIRHVTKIWNDVSSLQQLGWV